MRSVLSIYTSLNSSLVYRNADVVNTQEWPLEITVSRNLSAREADAAPVRSPVSVAVLR